MGESWRNGKLDFEVMSTRVEDEDDDLPPLARAKTVKMVWNCMLIIIVVCFVGSECGLFVLMNGEIGEMDE